MKQKKKEKLFWVVSILLGSIIAVGLILYAVRQQTDFYFNPSEIKQGIVPQDKRIRIGGVVVSGSVQRDEKNPLLVTFSITDCEQIIDVVYEGILPDLFTENSGIVATGKLQDKLFVASQIFAKHDENYMPPEVANSLKNDVDLGICQTEINKY